MALADVKTMLPARSGSVMTACFNHRQARHALHGHGAADLHARLEALAAPSFVRCMLNAQDREGVSAFVEKRKPSWVE